MVIRIERTGKHLFLPASILIATPTGKTIWQSIDLKKTINYFVNQLTDSDFLTRNFLMQ